MELSTAWDRAIVTIVIIREGKWFAAGKIVKVIGEGQRCVEVGNHKWSKRG